MDNRIILGGSLMTSDHFIIVMQLSETAHSLDHRSVEQWFLRHLEEHFDHPLSYVATDPTSRTWKTRFHYDKDKTQLHAVLHFETEQATAWHPSGLFLVRGIMPKDLAAHLSLPPEVTQIGISPVSEKQARLHIEDVHTSVRTSIALNSDPLSIRFE